MSWGCSSAGRAPRSQRGGQRFDPAQLHHTQHPATSKYIYYQNCGSGFALPRNGDLKLPVSAGGDNNPARGEGARDRMNQKAFASKLYYGSCCFVLFFVAAAASFNGYYDKWRFREAGTSASMQEASFDAMVDGTAARPFVYRQLLPMLANWIDRRVPEQTKDRLFAARDPLGAPLRERLFSSPVAQNRAYFLRYWIVYAAVFLFAWISVYAMYLLCKSVGYAPETAALSAIIMVLLMPYFMSGGGIFTIIRSWRFLRWRRGWRSISIGGG